MRILIVAGVMKEIVTALIVGFIVGGFAFSLVRLIEGHKATIHVAIFSILLALLIAYTLYLKKRR